MDTFRGQQGGIQMLLAAEQEAQHIITTARNRKMARLKQAKLEAEREVVQHRSQLEAEFQKKNSESSGSSEDTMKRLEKETEAKIKSMNELASKVSNDVIAMLVKYVTTVKI